jgi:cobalt/nickel transport system permease protein
MVFYFGGNPMHMSDALISPVVGGVMAAATLATAALSVKKVKEELPEKKIPLMGVMGAFIFAAQMINFTIPGTGSSGHLSGGLILAALLGPHAGFLAIAAVLIIQCLFFADGGLLALGCNIFNMGFFACFIAYPLIYRAIVNKNTSFKRILAGSLLGAVVALQLGAFSVVLETLLSGRTELPFGTFVLLMQPVHLAIGVVEGIVTAAVLGFVYKASPELIETPAAPAKKPMKKVLVALILCTLLTGGLLSWFASNNPDGLEWSIFNTTGGQELSAEGGVYTAAEDIQKSTAILPDYGFKNADESLAKAGTSASGIAGGAMTLALTAAVGAAIVLVKKKKKKNVKA